MAYLEINVNPKKKKTGDCAIRAVAVATGIGWDKAYSELAQAGFELKCEMSEVEAVEKVLLNHGFSVGKIVIKKGHRRPTVEEFATSHPDKYCVLRIANHLTCSGKGNYIDIWDCGDKAVYKYWYMKINN